MLRYNLLSVSDSDRLSLTIILGVQLTYQFHTKTDIFRLVIVVVVARPLVVAMVSAPLRTRHNVNINIIDFNVQPYLDMFILRYILNCFNNIINNPHLNL